MPSFLLTTLAVSFEDPGRFTLYLLVAELQPHWRLLCKINFAFLSSCVNVYASLPLCVWLIWVLIEPLNVVRCSFSSCRWYVALCLSCLCCFSLQVEVKAETFKVQSLNKIGHTNCFNKKLLSMPSSFAQRQTSSSAQRQTLPSCPLQSSGLSVKELRAKGLSKQQQLQQQRQQDTEQEQRREPWAKVHANTKPLPVKATQKVLLANMYN